MKSKNKLLIPIGVFASMLCACRANAAVDLSDTAVERTSRCPSGCFCLNGGEFAPRGEFNLVADICNQASAQLQTTAGNNYLCSGITVANSYDITADYYYDDFLQYYYSYGFGFYGFLKDGSFVFASSCQPSGPFGPYNFDSIFLCPESHPHSDPGAKAVTDCFKWSDRERNKKIYYKKPLNVSEKPLEQIQTDKIRPFGKTKRSNVVKSAISPNRSLTDGTDQAEDTETETID